MKTIWILRANETEGEEGREGRGEEREDRRVGGEGQREGEGEIEKT